MFDPRDVKVATLQATLPGAGPANFAAPANNNANKHRYLLAFAVGDYSAVLAYHQIALEDINGNLLIAASTYLPSVATVLIQPLVVGVPGANGLRLRSLTAGPDQAVAAWVQFADVSSPIVPAFAVNA
jgi:hypothetical protein